MGLDLISFNLKKAMKYLGCPVCSVQSAHELGYIRSFLWENVNAPNIRLHIFDTFGFCPQHIRQVGFLEIQMMDNTSHNNGIYRDLSGVIQGRLKRYAQRVLTSKQSGWKRWLRWLQPGILHLPAPEELRIRDKFLVCENGLESVDTHLECLRYRLSNPEDDFRKQYLASDRLCLNHLRMGLMLANRTTEAGISFLIEDTLKRLDILGHELDEYNRMGR